MRWLGIASAAATVLLALAVLSLSRQVRDLREELRTAEARRSAHDIRAVRVADSPTRCSAPAVSPPSDAFPPSELFPQSDAPATSDPTPEETRSADDAELLDAVEDLWAGRRNPGRLHAAFAGASDELRQQVFREVGEAIRAGDLDPDAMVDLLGPPTAAPE